MVAASHQLEHSQTSTTANIYAHVIALAEAKAVQIFDRLTVVIAPEVQDKPPAGIAKIR